MVQAVGTSRRSSDMCLLPGAAGGVSKLKLRPRALKRTDD